MPSPADALPPALAELESLCRAAFATWRRAEVAKLETAQLLGWPPERLEAAGVPVERCLLPREAERDRGTAKGSKRLEQQQELGWRVGECWRVHCEARRRWLWKAHTKEPHPATVPVVPPKQVRDAIRRAVLEHDADLLGAGQREDWCARSAARAAGIGLFLSEWHTATQEPRGDRDPGNLAGQGGKEYLEIWRAWKQLKGKGDPVPGFAGLYFARKGGG